MAFDVCVQVLLDDFVQVGIETTQDYDTAMDRDDVAAVAESFFKEELSKRLQATQTHFIDALTASYAKAVPYGIKSKLDLEQAKGLISDALNADFVYNRKSLKFNAEEVVRLWNEGLRTIVIITEDAYGKIDMVLSENGIEQKLFHLPIGFHPEQIRADVEDELQTIKDKMAGILPPNSAFELCERLGTIKDMWDKQLLDARIHCGRLLHRCHLFLCANERFVEMNEAISTAQYKVNMLMNYCMINNQVASVDKLREYSNEMLDIMSNMAEHLEKVNRFVVEYDYEPNNELTSEQGP